MELPSFAAFAEEVARAVGGKVVALDTGEWLSSVIHIGEHCVLLIRKHSGSFALSLPVEGSWQAHAHEDWTAAQPDIERALAAHRPVVSMSDVIARLPRQWTVSFPGTPVPSEAWLHRGGDAVGLFQKPESVMIVVWEGSTMHERDLPTLASLDGLSNWIEEKVILQARRREAATAELAADAARRAALPPPDFDEVMAALRDGQSFQIGGGRCFHTYEMKDGQLVIINFDEGHTDEHPCSEDSIRAAMADAPEVFRQILLFRSAPRDRDPLA